MGNPLTDYGLSSGSENISVQHELLLSIPSIEAPLINLLASLSKSTKDTNKTIKIVGYSIAFYLVLSGIARIIEAKAKESKSDKKDEEKN